MRKLFLRAEQGAGFDDGHPEPAESAEPASARFSLHQIADDELQEEERNSEPVHVHCVNEDPDFDPFGECAANHWQQLDQHLSESD